MNLNLVLQESIENLGAQISRVDAIIQVEHLPVITGHKNYLIQLFQNIISNGIKYQPEGQQPTIKVSNKQNTANTVITIKDNGIGIEKKHEGSVFNSFTRLHSHDEYEGSGIGLATCKKIMDIHKGNIEIKSEPGMGTEVIMYFPLFV